MVQVKGSVVSDTIANIKKRYGDQVYQQIISQLNKEDQKLFQPNQIILASSWYPLGSFVNLLQADIDVTANGNSGAMISRSEELIEKQLKGIYKVFVKIGSPEFVLKRISIVNQRYFNGISIELKMVSSQHAIVRYVGFEKQHQLIELNIKGFYKKALEISGAKNVQLKYLTSIAADKGFCELEIKWTDK